MRYLSSFTFDQTDGTELSMTASLLDLPKNFTFISQSVSITCKAVGSSPLLFQLELYNESGYLAIAFPPVFVSNTAGPVSRTYRWPPRVESVNGATAANNVFGKLRIPIIKNSSSAHLVGLISVNMLMGSQVHSLFSAASTADKPQSLIDASRIGCDFGQAPGCSHQVVTRAAPPSSTSTPPSGDLD